MDGDAATKKRRLELGSVSDPAMQGADKEKKDKKDKKDKKEKKEKKEGETAGADSDTEYPECNLADFPEKLLVKGSGSSKIDGAYARLSTPCRGRPAYSMAREGKKPVFFYFYKSNKWMIGFELGSHKNLAKVDDRVDFKRQPPCEPYPHTWKVLDVQSDGKDAKSKEYKGIASMRLIDQSLMDESVVPLGKEPEFKVTHHKKRSSSTPAQKDSSPVKPKEPKPALSLSKPAAVPGAKAPVFDAEAAAIEAAAAMDSDSDSDDDKDKKKKEAAKSQDEDSAEDSASDSDSDSDSGKSSSSASGSGSAAPKAAAKAAAKAASPPAAKAAPMSSKAQEIFVSLRKQLQSITNPAQRQEKLKQVQGKFLAKQGQLKGELLKEVQDVLQKLEKEFGTGGGPKAAPKAAARQNSGIADGGNAAPSTPPETNLVGTRLAPKSALRKRGRQARYTTAPRISWPPTAFTQVVTVESFRAMGEQLWFHAPGTFVTCDGCEKSVRQHAGALQGDPSKPQFAQGTFLCMDCLGQQQAPMHHDMPFAQ